MMSLDASPAAEPGHPIPVAGSARPSSLAARKRGHLWTGFALALTGLIACSAWAIAERPVAMPDFTGTIGGLSFSPFHRGETPESQIFPTPQEIKADLETAADLTNRIRTYTVQGVFARIPYLARDLPLRITLGAWLDTNQASNGAEVERLIETARRNSNVDRVLVGNEVLLRGDLTPAQLIANISSARQALHVPVSTAEPYHVWLKHPELAAAVDYITIHLLPYWEGQPVDKAVQFSLDRMAEVQAAYPNKHVVIGEIGWPSKGVDRGAARASRVNQAAFERQLFNVAHTRGLDYFVMEAFDQPWKTSFEGRAAGYWGMFDLDRHAKWPMTGPVVETPSWPLWALPGIALAALMSGALLSRRPDIRLPGKLLLAGLVQGLVATLMCVLLAMAGTYLSWPAATVWIALAGGQALLLLLLTADSFELAETIWGRVKRRMPHIVPAATGARLPKVSIHIAICNEPPQMVRQTLDAIEALDYPNFEVLVIDNNTVDPALWEPVAEHCARLGARFRFFHLGRWKGFKAGALNFALRETAADADIVAVLDSDYMVDPDWLRCMVPQFARETVGFVQSPQDYRDNDGSVFKRLMFWEYAGFFRLGMVTRNERNAIIQHGTMTLVRKSALADVGGWAEWCICEDAELGLKLFRGGWEAVYSSRSFGRGVMPDDFAAFRKQRARWAFGAVQICRRHLAALLSPGTHDLTVGQRWHFVTGWLPWLGDALGIAFLLLGIGWSTLLIAMPARFEFPIVLFMLPSIGLFVCKLVQTFLLYRGRVACGAADRMGAALAGLALSHTIGKAVWRGIFARSAAFNRTPKMERAPALVQGLVMVSEELLLLLLTWAAMAGVAIAHHATAWTGTLEARLWCLVLFTQSLPYAASVVVSLLAAVPAAKRSALPATNRSALPVAALRASGRTAARPLESAGNPATVLARTTTSTL